tara:strand:- start:45 stop:659 length:615 start_codon:yes stop_codon:yes gene_type:complete
MIRLLKVVVLFFFICSTSGNAGSINGKGELKMSNQSVNNFIEYIKINKKIIDGKRPKPEAFLISQDGSWSFYYYCVWSDCWQNDKPKIEECERITGVSCGRFAMRRKIFWDNGINTKKKKARFSSKMTDSEIRAKLTELGFIGDSSTTAKDNNDTNTKIKPKITKKVTQSNDDIVSKLKDLKDLLDSGVLTIDEFKKAKKKLLN